MHCTAGHLSLLHARQGGGTGLVLQLPRAAPRWPALQGGAGRGTGAQGGLGAWPPGAAG